MTRKSELKLYDPNTNCKQCGSYAVVFQHMLRHEALSYILCGRCGSLRGHLTMEYFNSYSGPKEVNRDGVIPLYYIYPNEEEYQYRR